MWNERYVVFSFIVDIWNTIEFVRIVALLIFFMMISTKARIVRGLEQYWQSTNVYVSLVSSLFYMQVSRMYERFTRFETITANCVWHNVWNDWIYDLFISYFSYYESA